MKTYTMKERPKELRPYERCLEYGPSVLSNAELLAIILRTGTKGQCSTQLAERILNLKDTTGNLLNILQLSTAQLMSIQGIGKVKAVQIQCLGEISKRISKEYASRGFSIQNPKSVATYYMEQLRHCGQEHLYLLLLNTKNQLIKEILLTKGTVNASLISPREIFVEALRHQAVYVLLLHNHPSGDPQPSREDIIVTKRIKEVGLLVGIELLDHIIIGDKSYVSLKERGLF